MSAVQLSRFASITTGFLVPFVGKWMNREWNFLQHYSIPEQVSGGLLVALLLTVVHVFGGPELLFNLESRDFLLVYFLTTVRMNARFRDLSRGGPALFIVLGLTIGFMTLQNVLGVAMAGVLGLHPATGLLVGIVFSNLLPDRRSEQAVSHWPSRLLFTSDRGVGVRLLSGSGHRHLDTGLHRPIAMVLLSRCSHRC